MAFYVELSPYNRRLSCSASACSGATPPRILERLLLLCWVGFTIQTCPLIALQVELQRIRVRQRHDPRTNGNLEDAAAFGMSQLKSRNSKNRELDVL